MWLRVWLRVWRPEEPFQRGKSRAVWKSQAIAGGKKSRHSAVLVCVCRFRGASPTPTSRSTSARLEAFSSLFLQALEPWKAVVAATPRPPSNQNRSCTRVFIIGPGFGNQPGPSEGDVGAHWGQDQPETEPNGGGGRLPGACGASKALLNRWAGASACRTRRSRTSRWSLT